MGGPAAASGLPSDDTHELGGDAVDDDEEDSLRGGDALAPPPPPPGRAVVDDDCPPPLPPRALDRLSLRLSSFDTLPPFLLILDDHHRRPLTSHCTHNFTTTALASQAHRHKLDRRWLLCTIYSANAGWATHARSGSTKWTRCGHYLGLELKIVRRSEGAVRRAGGLELSTWLRITIARYEYLSCASPLLRYIMRRRRKGGGGFV
jgi:hypothetical protein